MIQAHFSADAQMDPNEVAVLSGDEELKAAQSLVDFVFPNYHKLTIRYPDRQITFRERQPSMEMEDDDFFALFDIV